MADFLPASSFFPWLRGEEESVCGPICGPGAKLGQGRQTLCPARLLVFWGVRPVCGWLVDEGVEFQARLGVRARSGPSPTRSPCSVDPAGQASQ